MEQLKKEYFKQKEIYEIKELIRLTDEHIVKRKESLIYHFNPINNRLYFLITKYVPVENVKVEQSLQELIVIRKSKLVLYNFVSLNFIYLYMSYLLSNTTTTRKLILGTIGTVGLLTLINTSTMHSFNRIATHIIQPHLEYMLNQVERDYKNTQKDDKTENNNNMLNVNLGSFAKETVIDFCTNMLYSPTDISIENDFYFSNEHIKEVDPRDGILTRINKEKNKKSKVFGIRYNKL